MTVPRRHRCGLALLALACLGWASARGEARASVAPTVLASPPAAPPSEARDEELLRRREAAARGAVEVLPRLELAKALHDRGERLLAFAVAQQVAEEGHADFRRLFEHVFAEAPRDLSEATAKRLSERAGARPEDPEPLKRLADFFLWRRDFRTAADHLRLAARLAPDDFSIVADLSQSLAAAGDESGAQSVLEDWYRSHPDAEQTQAHRVQQLLGRNEVAARAVLERALEANPEAGGLLGLKAMMLDGEGRAAESEAVLRRAAAVSADNPAYQLALAALEAERDPFAARERYLNAYFLDPFAGVDAPASTRIKELTYVLGTQRFEAEGESCDRAACFESLLRDPNPVLITLALKAADMNWRPWRIEPIVSLLSHDDPDVRGKAASVLRRQVDESFLPRLRQLLQAPDLQARGLAAFLAVKLMGAESLPILESLLDSPAQAVRLQAIRALGSSGLEGSLDALERHLEEETQPVLLAETRSMLAQARQPSGAAAPR